MLEFNESDFSDKIDFSKGGKFDIPNEVYHASEGISNSGLLLVEENASNLIWSMNAPSKDDSAPADFGTALHTSLLEPHLIDSIIEAPARGRTTDKFRKFAKDNPDKTVLTQVEYEELKLMVGSAFAHPTINSLLKAKTEREQSIYVRDAETGMLCKIRPDLDFYATMKKPALGDVKSTANIEDWRSNVRWKNPLWVHGYGHQAAFYLHIATQFYNYDVTEFIFVVVSKSPVMGRFPVDTFRITQNELDEWGFTMQMKSNLKKYKKHFELNNWFELGKFNIE